MVAAARTRLDLAVPGECTWVGGACIPAPVPSDGCQEGRNLDAPYAVVAVAGGDQGEAAVGHCSGVE